MPPHSMRPAPSSNVAEEYARYERNPDISIAENVVRFYWLWFHTRLGRSFEYEAAERLIDLLPYDWEDWAEELLDDLTEPDAEIGRHMDFRVFVRHVLLHWLDHGDHIASFETLPSLDSFSPPTFSIHIPPPPQPASTPSHLYTIRSSHACPPHAPSFTVEPYSPPVTGYPLHYPEPHPSHFPHPPVPYAFTFPWDAPHYITIPPPVPPPHYAEPISPNHFHYFPVTMPTYPSSFPLSPPAPIAPPNTP